MGQRVYLHLVEPEKYPDFTRRAARAVTRGALGNTIQFTSLRGFSSNGGGGMLAISDAADDGNPPIPDNGSVLTGIEETISRFVDKFNLGRVLWPAYPTLFAQNFRDMVDLCAARGLYLYDFWGFVPGSKGVKDMWSEYRIPPENDRYMRTVLGDHFLGYDNGEQDGRYIHALAKEGTPVLCSRRMQYRNFQSYFEKLGNTMNNNMVTLASLTFLHYFAREGNTIMLGAETAQALPSNPMWFSFIRGASKQYGLLCYGNASIFNRWSFKTYTPETVRDDYDPGDEEPDRKIQWGYESGFRSGTSLSLLRRLIYNQYMYNCDILGFENGWLVSEKAAPGDTEDRNTCIQGDTKYLLTPIGEIQRGCVEYVTTYGSPGVMYTPVALIADSLCGWVPPRHLYSSDAYKVWGNLPYIRGDYQLHCLFSILYPGYQNGSFYHDERGFLTSTPYGECADVLFSDVRKEILNRYDTAVLVADTELDVELYEKLKSFVSNGGTLVTFQEELGSATESVKLDKEYGSFFAEGNHAWGCGRVIVFGGEALERTYDGRDHHWDCDEEMAQPFRFRPEVEKGLRTVFEDTRILYADNPALQYTLAVKGQNRFTLYVANNTLTREAFNIKAVSGRIVSVKETPLGDDTTRRSEFLPRREYLHPAEPVRTEGEYAIEPYDCRIFQVETEGAEFTELPESNPVEPDDHLFLHAGWDCASAKGFLLDHSTFGHHFGGLMLPAEYFDRLDGEAAEREGQWFCRHGMRILVDFTKMLNHYPDLSIIGNFPKRTEASIERMETIIRKASSYGCAGTVFALHRMPENEYSGAETLEGAKKAFKRLKEFCSSLGIATYLSNRPLHARYCDMDLGHQRSLAKECRFDGFALNTAFALYEGESPVLESGDSLVMLSDCSQDILGQKYASYNPLSEGENRKALKEVFLKAHEKEFPVVLTAEYHDWDSVMKDLQFLHS